MIYRVPTRAWLLMNATEALAKARVFMRENNYEIRGVEPVRLNKAGELVEFVLYGASGTSLTLWFNGSHWEVAQ